MKTYYCMNCMKYVEVNVECEIFCCRSLMIEKKFKGKLPKKVRKKRK